MPTGILLLADDRADLITRTLPEGYRVIGSRKCGYLFVELLIEGPGIPSPDADGGLPWVSLQMHREWADGKWHAFANFEHLPEFSWPVALTDDDSW